MNIKGGSYLTPEEFRKKVGFSKVSSIYRAIKKGTLKHIRVGNNIMIPSNAVIEDRRIKHGGFVGIGRAVREARERAVDNE